MNELADIKFSLDVSSIVVVTDDRGVITYVNDKFCEISKYSRDELIGKTHRIINSKHHPKEFFVNMWETISLGNVWAGEVKNRAKDGSFYWVKTFIVPFLKDDKPYQYIAIRTDITEQKNLEIELNNSLNELADIKLALDVSSIVAVTDERGVISYVNDKFCEISKYSKEELIGKTHKIINSDYHPPSYFKKMWRSISSGKVWSGEVKNKAKDGTYYWVKTFIVPFLKNEKPYQYIAIRTDITDQKNMEETIQKLAYYDTLTGLPNRLNMQETLQQALMESSQKRHNFSIFFIDLDRFKFINDSLGHNMGDLLLQQVAERLKICIRSTDVVSRQSGDEFILYFPELCKCQSEPIAQRIIQELSMPYKLGNNVSTITPSIGISSYPADGDSIEALLKNADMAMYHAKADHNTHYKLFSPTIENDFIRKLTIETGILKAIEKDEFFLLYQPQISTLTGKIIGTEALIRWNHPTMGMISPVEFIPIAEEIGAIIPLGKWVLRTACKQNKAWQDADLDPVKISVNISSKQFQSPNFVSDVLEILEETCYNAKYLELEITESIAMQDNKNVHEKIAQLKYLGIKIAMDDFGTGYSSLSYLTKFNLNTIKIDRSFINKLEFSKETIAIIRAIVSLAESLEINVIAEGVETVEQINLLHKLQCYDVQGFYFSRPLLNIDLEELLRQKILIKSISPAY
ncbi:hypothetical protein CN692_07365 [Bacillus sp. AFS002410]|nr:hypothetical protein CN692_07365 [Bacillus sp. AFS002410]